MLAKIFINSIDYYLFIFIDFIMSYTHSTQDLVVPTIVALASTTLIVKIPPTPSIMHGEKPEKVQWIEL
jgi:hypothetical protein